MYPDYSTDGNVPTWRKLIRASGVLMTSEQDGGADVTDKKLEVYRAVELGSYEKLTEGKSLVRRSIDLCTVHVHVRMHWLHWVVRYWYSRCSFIFRRRNEARSGVTSGSKQSHSSTIPPSEKILTNMYSRNFIHEQLLQWPVPTSMFIYILRWYLNSPTVRKMTHT